MKPLKFVCWEVGPWAEIMLDMHGYGLGCAPMVMMRGRVLLIERNKG